MGGSGFGGGGALARTRGAQQQQQGYISEGFPGIGSTYSAGGGFSGLGGGRRDRDKDDYDSPLQRQQEPVAREIVEPNGISIQGYTESPEAFKEFVQNLKLSNKFIEVYYSEADLIEVPEAEMYQAPVTAASVGPMGGGGGFGGGGGGRMRSKKEGL